MTAHTTETAGNDGGRASARVDVLTAEVRVLLVGSRQVTLSVYGQLDDVPAGQLTPMGRVAPKDARADWVYVVGRGRESGALVRSALPVGAPAAGEWAKAASRTGEHRRDAENAARQARGCDAAAEQCAKDAASLTDPVASYARVEFDDETFYRVAYAQAEAASALRDAERAAAEASEEASAEEPDTVLVFKLRADEARARYLAAQNADRAADAADIAATLTAQAAEWRDAAAAWRDREQQARQAVADSERADQEAAQGVVAVATEWEALPLIVLAGLR